MNSHIKSAVIALVAAILSLLMPTSAFAYSSTPLTFCNKSTDSVNLAYGYHSPGVSDPADHSILTGPFVSQGWRNVEPGACTTIDNPFNARYMFWFAAYQHMMSIMAQTEIRNANVPDSFCVTDFYSSSGAAQFIFEDQNVSVAACGDQDVATQSHNRWVHPENVDTWINATVNFTGQ